MLACSLQFDKVLQISLFWTSVVSEVFFKYKMGQINNTIQKISYSSLELHLHFFERWKLNSVWWFFVFNNPDSSIFTFQEKLYHASSYVLRSGDIKTKTIFCNIIYITLRASFHFLYIQTTSDYVRNCETKWVTCEYLRLYQQWFLHCFNSILFNKV